MGINPDNTLKKLVVYYIIYKLILGCRRYRIRYTLDIPISDTQLGYIKEIPKAKILSFIKCTILKIKKKNPGMLVLITCM